MPTALALSVGVLRGSIRNPRLIGELSQAARRRSHWRKCVLDSVQAMSLLTMMEIIGPVLLIAVLIYGTIQWSRRRRGPTEAVREGATRQLYREAAKAEAREGRNPAPPPRSTYVSGWCREAKRPCILTGLLRTLHW